MEADGFQSCAADPTFEYALEFWESGAPADPYPLDASRLLDLKASLRRAQRRLAESAAALARGEAAGEALAEDVRAAEQLAGGALDLVRMPLPTRRQLLPARTARAIGTPLAGWPRAMSGT